MSLFFGTPCSIDITIGDADTRPKVKDVFVMFSDFFNQVTVTEQGQSSHGKTVELFRYISTSILFVFVLLNAL